MHDAGAGVERYVLAQIDWRHPIVKRMAKVNLCERPALASAENRALGKTETVKTGIAQIRGQDQQSALRLHQVVAEFGMHVERLVGG